MKEASSKGIPLMIHQNHWYNQDKGNQNPSKSLVRPQKSISARASSITLCSTLPCFVRSAEKRVHPISTNLKIDLALSLWYWQLAPVSHPSLILPSTVCTNCRKPLSFPCHIAFRYSGSGTMILFFWGGETTHIDE